MNISLTKVSQKDLSKIILWRNSETVWRFSNQYILLNMKKQKQWFDQISKEDSKFVFMIHFNKKPVGVCSLINYQKELKCAEVSIMIGEKNLQGKCIGKQSLEKLLEFGKQLSMQIAASSPLAIDKDDLGQNIIEKEKEIIIEELKNSGKDNKILDKIAAGKLNKFISDNTLMNQEWIMEPLIIFRSDLPGPHIQGKGTDCNTRQPLTE